MSDDDFTEEDQIGAIPDKLNDLDPQEVCDQDRQVLDGRILGIINVFQDMLQS